MVISSLKCNILPMQIKYLEEYAEKFNVPTHVKFEHQVLSVKMTDDHISSGQWVVEVKDMTTDHTFKEKFDAVLVATGHHVTPLMPKFEGIYCPGKIVS